MSSKQIDTKQKIILGLSPCPNDTYIFHALLHKLVPFSLEIEAHFADVEELNKLAIEKTLAFSKISTGVLPYILNDYQVLAAGAALGWGCGPLVVAREHLPESAWQKARIAVPGLMTTANLLLDLHGSFNKARQPMLFSECMDAVLANKADIAVIIHEGRFCYAEKGLVKLLDLGEWWEEKWHIPLPLGAIVAKRNLPQELALEMQIAIKNSLAYAKANPEAGKDFIKNKAQEMADSIIEQHIKTFVTDFSSDLGKKGQAAITHLISHSQKTTTNKDIFLTA